MNKGALAIGIAIIVMGTIFVPVSRISEVKKVYTDQTQTVARGLCPPPILTYLETGKYHIEISEQKVIIGQNAMVVVYDQNGNVVYQSSLLESWEPIRINYQHDFVVYNSGVYNITLKDAWGFIVKVTTTTTVSHDIVTYPFEWFFHIGLLLVIIGVSVVIFSSVTEKR